jgi:hypothetical protein
MMSILSEACAWLPPGAKVIKEGDFGRYHARMTEEGFFEVEGIDDLTEAVQLLMENGGADFVNEALERYSHIADTAKRAVEPPQEREEGNPLAGPVEASMAQKEAAEQRVDDELSRIDELTKPLRRLELIRAEAVAWWRTGVGSKPRQAISPWWQMYWDEYVSDHPGAEEALAEYKRRTPNYVRELDERKRGIWLIPVPQEFQNGMLTEDQSESIRDDLATCEYNREDEARRKVWYHKNYRETQLNRQRPGYRHPDREPTPEEEAEWDNLVKEEVLREKEEWREHMLHWAERKKNLMERLRRNLKLT